jgi:SAM-dependent methyltransferase
MTEKNVRFLAAFAYLVLGASLGLAQDVKLDVPYVPTRYPVVDEMLRLLNLTKADVVYDLGCGDGRLVVGAAEKFGCRGVGIDIDPERIREANENAQKAGVTDKVKFILGDLFEADFREATAVPMYLLTSVNLKLRPKILRELRPGSRIVSHNFGMDNWKPDAQTIVRVEDIPHDVYFWIIPANVSGMWTWTILNGAMPLECKLEVTQKFQVLEGKAWVGGRSAEVMEVKLSGDKVSLVLDIFIDSKKTTLTLEGKAFLHQIEGAIKGRIDGRDLAFAWKAARNPTTETRIDDDPSWLY